MQPYVRKGRREESVDCYNEPLCAGWLGSPGTLSLPFSLSLLRSLPPFYSSAESYTLHMHSRVAGVGAGPEYVAAWKARTLSLSPSISPFFKLLIL